MKSALIIVGLLALGALGIIIPKALKKAPERQRPPAIAPLVSVASPTMTTGNLILNGTGTARSTREVPVAAEVAGKVVSVSPKLVTGGRFSTGQVLVSIDRSDFLNAVEVTKAAVTQRSYELILAKEESEIAKQEWDRAQKRAGTNKQAPSGELGSLALKEPQIRLAEAALRSAEAQLADAEKRLSRTRVRAPFNGQVKMKQVDVGQYLAPGQAVASYFGTDQIEITVALASSSAALLQETSGGKRPPALVKADFAGKTYSWDGYVHRVEGLDPNTRTLNVAVRVDNPYGSKHERHLLVDTFTSVEIAGQEVEDAMQVPSSALRENNTLWVVRDGTLSITPVDVIQETDDMVYVSASILGDVVTSDLDVVTDGMAVRVDR